MIDLATAGQLLDFSTRIGPGQQADEQLEGSVALHNILCEHHVAYLADEVGMGKTYVALGALALFRHHHPSFRVMIIAPRRNIQEKWKKELRNFVRNNIRFPDLRMKALGGGPARPVASCENLIELVHEAVVDPNRDFFLRLSSFSLRVSTRDGAEERSAERLRDGLRKYLPWIRSDVFDLRNKAFKDNIARAICCALPVFDLVIVDEGHNLKHGFSEHAAARNRVLGLVFGNREPKADPDLFPHYGPRARRVLFLSATPIEESYIHLWNQLDVFGLAGPFAGLRQPDLPEEEKKKIASQFLLRRVTTIRVSDTELTKNLYRREWRRGGVHQHDEPIRVQDDRQRLVVALMQKKVSELISHERFNSSYQIGMLASFESFLETTKTKRAEEDESTFDDATQTDDAAEREGIDVADVNRIARSYRKRFERELPHPKMDALVESLASSWQRGEKALVFVRRVASVKELKRKLDERYDLWLLGRLRREFPESVHKRLDDAWRLYRDEKENGLKMQGISSTGDGEGGEEDDHGGTDTFFEWFFRGEGPRGFVSGANIQRRFIQRGAIYATFFEDNHVAALLGCRPGEVGRNLAQVLQVDEETMRLGLQGRSAKFLSRAKKHARADRFEAVQAAAIEWLKDTPGPLQEQARIAWEERYSSSVQAKQAKEAPDIGDWLELHTFFTELRLHPDLRRTLWPEPSLRNSQQAFREQELRAQMLASAARLGHAFIDLYLMTIKRLGSLDLRAQESTEGDEANIERERIQEYIQLLESQRVKPREERDWGAYDELAEIAAHFDLILDVNAPDAQTSPLSETARAFGGLLGQQQPVGGMAGQVNQTMVRQFRMPGYPLVLVSTDLLQEGEDLHTFCSAVYHYGISWTPSSMEQRIGRIDRLRSQTSRRLNGINAQPQGEEMLQVYFPHLEETIEVLQVQRVLERMNTFLRLMHEGLTTAGREDKKVDVHKEIAKGRRVVEQIRDKLKSAFPVKPEQLRGDAESLPIMRDHADIAAKRLAALAKADIQKPRIAWEPPREAGRLTGTATLGDRRQPFTLLLQSYELSLLIRCISPVGRVDHEDCKDDIKRIAGRSGARIGAIETKDEDEYNLTVEDDVLFGVDPAHDQARVSILIRRVTQWADELERKFLPDKDEGLEGFRNDLDSEAPRGY